ncbi:MAG: hypothetical protein NTU93_18340 [Arthrobacter sp.]|nr:hypothetical protein [Arthrobacter sp.]
MTELNPSTDDTSESAGTRVDWPATTGNPAIGDPAVEALLSRLGTLPELPVSAHGEVYAGLHDGLAEALNEDVAGQPAGDTRP